MAELTNLSSTSDWPANAVPQDWIDSLFAKMSAMYGSKLSDMWRNSELAEVRKLWGVELAKLSRNELRAGVNAMTERFRFPPTLPEFCAACREERRQGHAMAVHALESTVKASPHVVGENMKKIRAAQRLILEAKPNAGWAFRLLARGKSDSGKALPDGVVECAQRAMASSAGRRFFASGSREERELYRSHFELACDRFGKSAADVDEMET